MSKQPLFSFGIVSYNNYKYIMEAVDSVLMQTYSNIELIISNDGSPDFDEDELRDHIEKNKKENITNLIINNYEKNGGTVKNVNFVAKRASGKYFMIMAADDALYDEKVLQKFVDCFEERSDEIKVLSGKIAMCGSELTDIVNYEPQPDRIELLKKGDNDEIFSKLTYDSFIPTTSTCMKLQVLKDTDYYDEGYYIIEDATKYINLINRGIKFGWIDDFVAARHRDGGVSHGNKRNKSESFRRYRYDEIRMFLKEILPYKSKIKKEDYYLFNKKWTYIKNAYYCNFIYREDSEIKDYREYDIVYFQSIEKEFEKERKKKIIQDKIKGRATQINIKNTMQKMILLLTVIIFMAGIKQINEQQEIFIVGSDTFTNILICGVTFGSVLLFMLYTIDLIMKAMWIIYKLIVKIRYKRG